MTDYLRQLLEGVEGEEEPEETIRFPGQIFLRENLASEDLAVPPAGPGGGPESPTETPEIGRRESGVDPYAEGERLPLRPGWEWRAPSADGDKNGLSGIVKTAPDTQERLEPWSDLKESKGKKSLPAMEILMKKQKNVLPREGPPQRLYTAARQTQSAAEYAGRRKEAPTAVPPIPLSEGIGAGPAEMDAFFQRDARRYDGGFTLY